MLGGFASSQDLTLKTREPMTLRSWQLIFSASLITGCTGLCITLGAWALSMGKSGEVPIWLPPASMAASLLIGLRGPSSVMSIWNALASYIAKTHGADAREPEPRYEEWRRNDRSTDYRRDDRDDQYSRRGRSGRTGRPRTDYDDTGDDFVSRIDLPDDYEDEDEDTSHDDIDPDISHDAPEE